MPPHEVPDEPDVDLDELQELFDKESEGRLTESDRLRLQELLELPVNRSSYQAWTRAARAGAALSRSIPSPGFAERVIARLPSAPHDPGAIPETFLLRAFRWWLQPRTLRWNPLAAAALGALLLTGGAVLVRPDARPNETPEPDAATVRFVYYGQAGRVSVAGTFNGWSTEAAAMNQVRPGVWTVEIPVRSGTHEYAFVLDGARWVADPAAPQHVDDGFGQTNARLEI